MCFSYNIGQWFGITDTELQLISDFNVANLPELILPI